VNTESLKSFSDLASTLKTNLSQGKTRALLDVFHTGNSDEPRTFWGYGTQAPLTFKL